MRIRESTLAACVLFGVASSPAVADKTVAIEATGCPSCTVSLASVEQIEPYDPYNPKTRGFRETFRLVRGRVLVSVPSWVDSLQVGVTTKGGVSGPGSETTVAWQYRGYAIGEAVGNGMSRRGNAARICAPVDDGVTLRFRVDRDRGPKRWRKDPTINGRRYLRAWASPTIRGLGDFYETQRGYAGAQNSACGMPGYR